MWTVSICPRLRVDDDAAGPPHPDVAGRLLHGGAAALRLVREGRGAFEADAPPLFVGDDVVDARVGHGRSGRADL